MAKNLDITILIDIYGYMLTDKQIDALELYYFDDLSLAEIAENLGITRQGVRDSIKRGEETLIDLEEKLGYLKKIRKYDEFIKNLKEQTKLIIEECKTISFTRGIVARSEAIIGYIDQNSNHFEIEENADAPKESGFKIIKNQTYK